MSENVDKLIIEHLRGLRAGQDRIENKLHELATRLASLAGSTAAGRRGSVRNCGTTRIAVREP